MCRRWRTPARLRGCVSLGRNRWRIGIDAKERPLSLARHFLPPVRMLLSLERSPTKLPSRLSSIGRCIKVSEYAVSFFTV